MHWYWSHDIRPDQLGSLSMPGTRLVRLASYGEGDRRRYAAVMYQEPGAARSWLLDVDPGALPAWGGTTGGWPVAVTAGPGARLSLLLDPSTVDHELVVGLDEPGLRALAGGGHVEGGPTGGGFTGGGGQIVDVATYLAGGTRRYAAVTAPGAGPSRVLTGLTAATLRTEVRRCGAPVARLRGYLDGDERRWLALVRPSPGRTWWYPDLDADGVAGRLAAHRAYPLDLDAVRDGRGVRYAVVMGR